tara:strand:+ start:423 stop:2747 length:2325 start_codon:yes stop_codon:yes gene_type:complete
MKKAICALLITFSIQSQEDFDLSILDNLDSLPDEVKEKLISEDNNLKDPIEVEDNLKKKAETETNEIIKSDKFGFDFFNIKSQTKTPILDVPLQSDYALSFNDELELLLVGNENRLINLRIDLSGSVMIPEIGSVSLLNLTISEANKKISTLISSAYLGTESYLNVKNPSLKKISIIGSVNEPGTYLVNPFISITEAIKYASGLTGSASLRTIEVISAQGDISEYDLYDFLIFGDRTSDANLKNGDTIRVKSTSKFVDISGSVHRPMTYEYKNNDTYDDLLEFSLGINRDGMSSNISSNKRESTRIYTSKVKQKEIVGESDLIELFVGKNVITNDKDIFITGTGVTSGYFSTPVDGSIKDLLNEINFSSNIYPFYAVYEEEADLGLTRKITAFSLADPNTYKNIRVKNNSRIFFYDRDYIIDIVNAPIVDEDNIENKNSKETNDSMPIDSYLQSLSAVDPLISSHLSQLFKPDRSLSIPLRGKVTPRQLHSYFGISDEIEINKVSVISINKSLSDAYDYIVDADDLVAISLPPVKADLIQVEILGEISNPGKYSVSSSTSLDDIYTLAGGLRSNAFEKGISLYREEVKEKQEKAIKEAKSLLTDSLIQNSANVSQEGMIDIEAILKLADLIEPNGRVAGDFSVDSEISKYFLLKDADVIVIPSISSEVTVQGEVLNSSSFVFEDNMTYQDYINSSGGFTDSADKRAIFIIKANGESITVGRNRFAGNQVDIEAGDTIVVPRDLNKVQALPMISMATKIISDIAFSAASLNAISN